jgi:hypothetical protein
MKLSENYTTTEKADKEGKEKRTIISNEAYVICEFLEELTKTIRIRGLYK